MNPRAERADRLHFIDRQQLTEIELSPGQTAGSSQPRRWHTLAMSARSANIPLSASSVGRIDSCAARLLLPGQAAGRLRRRTGTPKAAPLWGTTS